MLTMAKKGGMGGGGGGEGESRKIGRGKVMKNVVVNKAAIYLIHAISKRNIKKRTHHTHFIFIIDDILHTTQTKKFLAKYIIE